MKNHKLSKSSMASSNRHWPSMFKSKPCNHNEFNSPHYSSTPCKSNPFPSIGDGSTMEERTPEPKPRWNPKPEQIRILEAIFNSGMVNPPREEIKKIRAQLQEYGQVGDANVFYWFQNRKSRSKQKNRQLLHNSSVKSTVTNPITPQTPPLAAVAPSSSSSSSSDRSSPNNKGPISKLDISNSQNYTNFNEPYLHHEVAAPPPPSGLPFFFPVQQNGSVVPGLCFNEYMGSGGGSDGGGFSSFSSEVVNPVMSDQNSMGSFSDMLLGDMPRRMFEDESFLVTNPTNIPPTSSSLMLPNSISHLQGTVDPPSVGRLVAKSTVFINDVSFEVPALGPFNVREAFGEDVVLVHQSGHPVPTTDWGLTLHPLQHGACYFLARSVASSKHHGSFASAPHDFLPPSEYPFNL